MRLTLSQIALLSSVFAPARVEAQGSITWPAHRAPIGYILLSSGDSLPVWHITRFDVTSDSTTLVMDYQTTLSLRDTNSVEKEILAVWQYFRPMVEGATLSAAAIRAMTIDVQFTIPEVPRATPETWYQHFKMYGVVFRRDSAGWHTFLPSDSAR